MNEELERQFSATCRVLLGKALAGLDDHREWLAQRVPIPRQARSAISGKEVWVPPTLIYMGKEFNLANAVSFDEMDKLPATPFKAGELEGAGVEEIAGKFVDPIRYYCGNVRYQAFENVERCSGAGGGRNIYYCEDVYLGVRNVAFSQYVLYTENAFGCQGLMNSSFLIHAYDSTKVARCFEIEGCSNSSGLLFCHNCENVHESMFCFNAKNLRNAIGNVRLDPERYKAVKGMILSQIVSELEKTKALGYDIFNIGAGRETLWFKNRTKG